MAANHLPQARLPIPGLKTLVFGENIITMWSVIPSTEPLVIGISTHLQGNGTALLSFERQPWHVLRSADRCCERRKKEMPWSLPQRSIAWWEEKHIIPSPNRGSKILEHRYPQVLRWPQSTANTVKTIFDKALFQVRRLARCQWPLRWTHSFSLRSPSCTVSCGWKWTPAMSFNICYNGEIKPQKWRGRRDQDLQSKLGSDLRGNDGVAGFQNRSSLAGNGEKSSLERRGQGRGQRLI